MECGGMTLVTPEVSEVRLTYRNRVKEEDRTKISCAYEIADLVRRMSDMDESVGYRELFYAVYMDTAQNVLAVMKVSEGGLNSTSVDRRMIFQAALLLSSTVFAVVHNHPSGVLTPSRQDLSLVEGIRSAAELLDIKLLDSIIIGEDPFRYYSFVEEGRM